MEHKLVMFEEESVKYFICITVFTDRLLDVMKS